MWSEYNLYVRNRTGVYKTRLDAVESVDIIERINDPGSWSVQSVTKEPCPFAEGDGIIVSRDGQCYYSGVLTEMQEIFDAYSNLYTWTVKGVGDLGFLTRRVCYPDPGAEPTPDDEYYTDTGSLGEVVKKIIDKNLGASAILARKEPLIAETIVVDAGESVSVSLRFQTILDAIAPILDAQGFCVRSEWDIDQRKIVYKICKGLDNSSIMVFSTAFNSILSTEYDIKSPQGNYIIAGPHALTEQDPDPEVEPEADVFAFADNGDSISTWGRVESFKNSESTEESEVQAEADTALSEYSKDNVGYSSVINSADYKQQYKEKWDIGDYVAVFVHGKKFVQRVMQVETKLAYGEETITPTIGTIKQGQLMKIFDKLNRLRSDVDQLQSS